MITGLHKKGKAMAGHKEAKLCLKPSAFLANEGVSGWAICPSRPLAMWAVSFSQEKKHKAAPEATCVPEHLSPLGHTDLSGKRTWGTKCFPSRWTDLHWGDHSVPKSDLSGGVSIHLNQDLPPVCSAVLLSWDMSGMQWQKMQTTP